MSTCKPAATPTPAATISWAAGRITLSDDSDLSLQSYIDQTHLALPIGPLTVNGLQFAPPGNLYDDLTTYDVDFQHRFQGWRAQPNRLGLRVSTDSQTRSSTPPALGFSPAVLDQNLYSAFVQDEIRAEEQPVLHRSAPSWSTMTTPASNSNPMRA